MKIYKWDRIILENKNENIQGNSVTTHIHD